MKTLYKYIYFQGSECYPLNVPVIVSFLILHIRKTERKFLTDTVVLSLFIFPDISFLFFRRVNEFRPIIYVIG